MAWTAPRTYAVNEVVTAAILNGDIRDNLKETAPFHAAAQGDIFYATAANAIADLSKGTAVQQLRMVSGATAPEWKGAVAAAASHNAAQTITTGTTTTLNFNTENYDTDSIHDTVTDNDRMTAPTIGKYLAIATVEWAANGTGSRYVSIRNQVPTIISEVWLPNNGGSDVLNMQVACIVNLAANDWVNVRVFQNSGGDLDIATSNPLPLFELVWLGA